MVPVPGDERRRPRALGPGHRHAHAEAEARSHAADFAAAAGEGGFAEHLDDVPALLLVVADLRALAAVDRDLDRYTLVGGASIYPFCWSMLLAARAFGLGGVFTTMVVAREDEVREVVCASRRRPWWRVWWRSAFPSISHTA